MALFVDISGFTAMSEALSDSGRFGSEELTNILNDYFRPMIDLVHSYGGDVLKFSGDGMTILFPFSQRNARATISRAVQCALDMQGRMARYKSIVTSAGNYSLAIKAGLAAGQILSTNVGDPAVRLEYVAAGGVLDRCAEAEHHAVSNEVVIHSDLLNRKDNGILVAEGRGDYHVVEGLLRRPRRSPIKDVQMNAGAVAILAPFLHPVIAQRLQEDHAGLVNEHRKVSILFIDFGSRDYDGDLSVGEFLNKYFAMAVVTIQNYDGYLYQIEMGDKGSKYIVLFGAPMMHENDEQRALHCAMDLKGLTNDLVRIGATAGSVFCGQIGAPSRHTYAVIGDPVNLAARLMQAAEPGEILVSGMAEDGLPKGFASKPLKPFSIKGKRNPVPVFAVRPVEAVDRARLEEPSPSLPLIGRRAEMSMARHRMQLALEGHGQVIGITGEAGIGKSRLSGEIRELAESEGQMCHQGACLSHGSSTSYLVWREVWRSFFGLDSSSPPAEQVKKLEGYMSDDQNFLRRVPLLGPVLNLQIPDNDTTDSLDAEVRMDSLRSLLLECLRKRTTTAPLMLVLEDCQWIDSASHQLIEYLARNLTDLPLLMVLVYRPSALDVSPMAHVMSYGHSVELVLAELSPGEAEELIVMHLEGATPLQGAADQSLISRVIARSGGNPFYIEELLNYVRDQKVDFHDGNALEALALPESLNTAITARIDQLQEPEKTTLKVASVLGRSFKAHWIWGSYPQGGMRQLVGDHLRTLQQLGLIVVQEHEPEPAYVFKHTVIHEVVYHSLSLASRELLHECVGQFIERTYSPFLDQLVDDLAHHYGSSRNTLKQVVYFRQAAERAKAAFTNDAAIDYYQRLLTLLPEPEQSRVLVTLGEIWQLTGKWMQAEGAFRRALQTAVARREEAAARRALGSLLAYNQSYDESLQWLVEARDLYEAVGDEEGVATTLECLARTYLERGDYPRALSCGERQMEIASAQGDEASACAAGENLGRILWQRGEYRAAIDHFERVLASATRIGYRQMVVAAGNDMAGCHTELGEYDSAVKNLQSAFDAATAIGYQWACGLIVGNTGRLYLRLGEHRQASICFGYELRLLTELGNWRRLLNTLGDVAVLKEAQGSQREAEYLVDRAIRLGRAMEAPYFLCELLHLRADLHTRRMRYGDAKVDNQEALRIATALDDKDVQLRANILSLRLRAALGEPKDEVLKGFEALLGPASGDREAADINYEKWCLDPLQEASRVTAANLYGHLHERMPDVTYRRRYKELTGEVLSRPPALPPLPRVVAEGGENLDTVLSRAFELSQAVILTHARSQDPRPRIGKRSASAAS
ncbi:MAG: tetratricopeptide repeat protein [Actinomycetota bacterium]|nr:tetratricopeptide repeat protein [Actinomycetota bacterium]